MKFIKYITLILIYIGLFIVQLGGYFYTQSASLIEIPSIKEISNATQSQILNPSKSHKLSKTKLSRRYTIASKIEYYNNLTLKNNVYNNPSFVELTSKGIIYKKRILINIDRGPPALI